MVSKSKKKVSNIMLVIACTMITLYAIASFILQYFVQTEISTTLTTSWFAFWGSELFLLAGIKVSKVIKGEGTSSTEDSCNDESVEAD
jgi:hypothetical protein